MPWFQVKWNHSALTIEDLYNPEWVKVYSIFWDVSLLITTVFFIFMLYVIIKESTKEMKEYKWYLCHQLFWSYLFDCHMSFWKPVPLWPFYIGYSAGIYSNLTEKLAYLPFILAGFIMHGLSISLLMSFLYRYTQSNPFSKFTEIYNKKWTKSIFYGGISLFFILTLVPLAFLAMPDFEEFKTSMINQNSAFEVLFEKESSIFGYDSLAYENFSIIFIFTILILVVITIIGVGFMYFHYKSFIKSKTVMSETTFNMQINLFKALSLQMVFIFILLVLPLLIPMGLAIWGFRWLPKLSIRAFCIPAFHTLFDFTVVILYVKVYRNLFIKFLKISFEKIGFKFKITSAMTPAISISNI